MSRNGKPINALSEKELYWLAGLLEGEGCFTTFQNNRWLSLRVIVQMTDKDIIDRIKDIVGTGTINEKHEKRPNRKQLWSWVLPGANASLLMQQVYPIMGERRQRRITELLKMYSERNRSDA